MPRWIQRVRKDGTTYMEPRDEAARRIGTAAIHGDIEAFVSPVDGTVISDRKQLREHNERNGVVNTAEFGTDHWDRKAKERADFYEGKRTARQTQKDRMEINEIINHLERR